MNTLKFISVLILCLSSSASFAQWNLDTQNSLLNFISIKKGSIAETHGMKFERGSIDKQGQAQLSLALPSVESRIPIRNERMKQYLFELEKFPSATVTATIDTSKVKSLKVGEQALLEMSMTLSMHGAQKNLSTQVRITRLNAQRIMASPVEPILIQAQDLNMQAGIDKLKELASLPSIASAVPVTFTLFFDEKS